MTYESEIFTLPDGAQVSTGLQMPTEESNKLSEAYPVYSENFYLDKADIEKALRNDVYKTFRRARSRFILNQGRLGKCNASAAVGAFHNMRSMQGLPEVVLSDCYVYMHINGGRDAGSQLVHSLEFSKKGVAPRQLNLNGKEVIFPANVYNKRQISPGLLTAAAEVAKAYTSFEAYRLPSSDYNTFKIALASALARDHQVIHAWHVGRNSTNLRKGYVVIGGGSGNHATLFHSARWVGGEDLVHPDVQNSWGPAKDPLYGPVSREGWGEDGFGLMTMQDAYACARNHVFWVFPGNKVN